MGRYLLREPIGRGAVGEVWCAEDPQIARVVAVKILNLPEGVGGHQKAEWERRFVREARAAGMLSHPGIVTIHDVGMTEDGRPFIVMELVEGLSLDAIMREGRTPSIQMALEWGAQVAEALDAAHRRGIVHRDVKPANVLIDKDGRARIADFGIARLSESDLTHEGLFLGSPAFASPEQIRGSAVDGRSDLFSLGAALYMLLTGVRPFRGEDLSSLAYAICHVEPAPLRRFMPDLSRECEGVIMKALEKDPDRRYRTGQDLAQDLRATAAGQSPAQAVVGLGVETTMRNENAPPSGSAGGRAASLRRLRDPRHGAGHWAPHTGAAMVIAVAMAIAAATVGGYLLTRPVAAPSGSRGPAGVQAGIASLLAGSKSAAAPRSVEPAPRAEGDGGPDAALVAVHVVHGLPDGVLTIWSGKRRLLRARLEAPGKSVGASSIEVPPHDRAAAEWPVRLPAGKHLLRVKVTSSRTGLNLQEELSRTVKEEQLYRLHVFVKSRPSPRLELMWADN